MQSLIKQLNNLPTLGIITSAGEHYSVVDLIKKADQIRLHYPQLRQAKVALRYTNLAEFSVALIAFDGWCSAIYLCPPDVLIPQAESIKWPLNTDFAAKKIL